MIYETHKGRNISNYTYSAQALNWVGTQIQSFLLNWFQVTWLGIALTTGKMFVCYDFKCKTMLYPITGI